MRISPENIVGEYRPFELFSNRADIDHVHRFLNFALLNGIRQIRPDNRQIMVEVWFDEFDELNCGILSRILVKYGISKDNFCDIITGSINLMLTEKTLTLVN